MKTRIAIIVLCVIVILGWSWYEDHYCKDVAIPIQCTKGA